MFRKQKKNRPGWMTGLMAAAGAAGAYFGIRRLVMWRRERGDNWLEEYIRQPAGEQADFGSQDEASGAARRLTRREGQSGVAVREAEVANEEIGSRYQSQAQPNRQPIPATGVTEKEIRASTQEIIESVQENPPVDDMVPQLAHYLLLFNDMMEQIRARRQESGDMSALHSLRPEDRNRFYEALDGLEGAVPDYGPGNLIDGSTQERVYNLTVMLRDAMKNMEYTDDDLFRINGKVRSEVCQVLGELGPEHLSAGDDVERAWRIYGCGV